MDETKYFSTVFAPSVARSPEISNKIAKSPDILLLSLYARSKVKKTAKAAKLRKQQKQRKPSKPFRRVPPSMDETKKYFRYVAPSIGSFVSREES